MILRPNIEEGDLRSLINTMIQRLHEDGPVNEEWLETLAYVKELYPKIFKSYERTLMYEMGLFYKTDRPKSIFELVYDTYKKTIVAEIGNTYSPVQYSAIKNIENNQVFSFSAPTSSDKSYLFREILKNAAYDVVIVLPSRALIAEYLNEIKKIAPTDTLVLQFVENINIDKTRRRIFVITPERAMDLYSMSAQLDVKLVIFDEAQLIEDEYRGLRFDEMVRRVREEIPQAKLVFAHPFVENPDAQIKRNKLENTQNRSVVYQQRGVGKICLFYDDENRFYYFSPYHRLSGRFEVEDVVARAIQHNQTVLIYVSKSYLYQLGYLKKFESYINLCGNIKDEKALQIIEKLQDYIGGNTHGEDASILLQLIRKGIVIHHGSIPLKCRMLIEQFVNNGYARICFATSTLMQGINMPFDVVWVDNFYFPDSKMKVLDFKNLIGRAGRTSKDKNAFDYGYVVVSDGHRSYVRKYLQDKAKLTEKSLIDAPIEKIPEESRDIVESILDNSFDRELQITSAQKTRLIKQNVSADVRNLIELLFSGGEILTGEMYNRDLTNNQRDKVKELFRKLYIKHLRRSELSSGEKSILSASIPIMLWRIQGKSFKEIVALRKHYIMEGDKRRELRRQLTNHEISEADYTAAIANIEMRYTPIADTLPQDKNYHCARLFAEDERFDYDKLVYDTYDYLDKVISFSISTPISAAVMIYYQESHDERAKQLYNYIRYGTNDSKEIMLCRYGFELDDMEWLHECVDDIDEHRILFNAKAYELDEDKKELIKRYL